MKVRDWMRRDVRTVTPDTTVTEVARLMVNAGLSCLPVVDESGAVVGIVTDNDMVAKHARLHFPKYFSILGFTLPLESGSDEREIEKALAVTVANLMTRDVVAVAPEADIDDAATIMADGSLRCLPVVEDGNLVGLLTDADIVRLLVVEDAV